jgi:general secretion pathway protein K
MVCSRPRHALRSGSPGESGAALLVALVAIAILTALAVDLSYETQVRLRTAANARDELRAAALAHSAVTFSRLVLGFQAQLDQSMAAGSQALSAATGGAQGAAAGTALPRPQLWKLVQVDSALTQALFGEGEGATAPAAPAAPASAPGTHAGGPGVAGSPGATLEGAAHALAASRDPEGGFEARIEDEGQKINVQLDALGTTGLLGPQVEALLHMMCDAKWDPLFDRTDADGQRYSRADLIVNLKDWVDEDATASVLTASFPGGNCTPIVPSNPFESGFSDENYPYDRGADRYKAKNARMDSLDELHLVAGVSDAFMAAFGAQLTVYLPNATAMNVNTDDPRQQLLFLELMSDPSSRAVLLDPAFPEKFHKALVEASMGGFVALTPAQFQAVGTSVAPGLKPRADLNLAGPKSPFTDHSVVFRIRALGVAGDVTHETEAVVTFDPNENQATDPTAQAAAASQLPTGRVIHWREE